MQTKQSQSMIKECLATKGFSLVEIVLVSTLFVLLASVLLGNFIYAQESTMLAGNRSRAVFLSEEGLEAARNIRDEDFANLVDGTYGLYNVSNEWQLTGPSDQTDIFVRQIEISTVDSNTKQIISRVNWQQSPQRTGEIALTTYLSNWAEVVQSNCEIDPDGTYIEAENFTDTISQGTATFVEESSTGGYNGASYLRSSGGSYDNPPSQEGKRYLVNFTDPGTYNVWVRGYGLDSGTDSVWIGLNDASIGALTENNYNQWDWTNTIQTGSNTISIPVAGNYYINVWVRENDHLLDGIYLTTGIEVPSGGIPTGKTVVDPTACTLSPPITSCDAYCQDQGYVSGTCRADSVSCTNNGEIYQSSGDLYCTAGPSEDTCCCLPGSDIVAPAAISDLSLSSPTGNSIYLTWTAPGDDGTNGTATTYDIRYSTSVINDGNWSSASQVAGEPSPSVAGSSESMTVSGLNTSTLYYFAIKTSDEVPNQSGISNVPSLSTTSGIGDWSNPSNPANSGLAGNANGWKIQVVGDYAYVVRLGNNPDFAVYDLSNPDAPSLVASVAVSGGPRDIYVSGDYAYIATNGTELAVYNISTPSSPVFTGSFNASGGQDGYGVYVVGTTVYMVRDSDASIDELVIIDASNPASMSQMGSLDLTADGNEIYVSGNYAYIASDDNSQELQVVDISNPGSLSIDGSVDLSGSTNCDTITGFGDYVILGRSNGDLNIIDISTPTSPLLVGSDTTSINDDLRDLSLGNGNNYVFVASDDNSNEFGVYDISTPSSPSFLGGYNFVGDINGVAYYPTGDRAYGVGDDNSNEFNVFAPQ